MSTPLRLLLVEDSASDAELLVRELQRAGFDPQWRRVETEADYVAGLDEPPDLILSDYSLPQFDGLRALKRLRESGRDIPFILISGALGEEAAVEAMKQGATDYLLKDRIARLGSAVERALGEKQLRDERRRVEEKLAASERHLRAIFETEPECVKLLVADGSLLEINPAGLRMLEADSFQQVENHCVYPFVVEEHRAAFRAFNERVFAGESSVLEFEITGLKGSRRWLETHASPLRDAAGVVTALLGITRDITERKQAEAAVREGEARFRAIFEQAAVGVAQVAPDGRWLDVNQRLCEIVGYTREELLNATFQGITHPDDLEADLAFVCRMLADEITTYAMEKRYRRKDGSLVWIHLTVSLVRGPLAVPLYFISVVQDISQRKRTEAAAERRRAELQIILDVVPALIFYKDLEGRFVLVNRALAEAVGLPPEAFIGKTDADLGSPYAEARRADDRRVLDSGTPVRQREERLHTVAGDRWLLTDKIPYRDETGGIAGIIGLSVDITLRKQAEAALRASREQLRNFARRLQVIREEERTGIAREIHDVLAQELTRLKLDLSWLGRRVARPVDDGVRAGLAQKVSSMIELADVTIESVQKLATDLRPVVLDSLGLGPAIEWLAEDFQRRAGIRCAARVSPELPALERAQSTALFRIVQESLTNVIRHAGANSVEVALGAHGANLRLTVRDDGRGITPKEQADPRSIGLLGMRERAALLGGETEIAPAPGGGTIVTVTAPLRALSGEEKP